MELTLAEFEGYSVEKEDAACAAAEEKGAMVLNPSDTQLQLDLDNEESWNRFQSLLPMLHKKFLLNGYLWWYSKSGAPHRHVVINLKKPLKVRTRIALQAVLGSDPKRELINISKAVYGVKGLKIMALFKPKDAKIHSILGPAPDVGV